MGDSVRGREGLKDCIGAQVNVVADRVEAEVSWVEMVLILGPGSFDPRDMGDGESRWSRFSI